MNEKSGKRNEEAGSFQIELEIILSTADTILDLALKRND